MFFIIFLFQDMIGCRDFINDHCLFSWSRFIFCNLIFQIYNWFILCLSLWPQTCQFDLDSTFIRDEFLNLFELVDNGLFLEILVKSDNLLSNTFLLFISSASLSSISRFEIFARHSFKLCLFSVLDFSFWDCNFFGFLIVWPTKTKFN